MTFLSTCIAEHCFNCINLPIFNRQMLTNVPDTGKVVGIYHWCTLPSIYDLYTWKSACMLTILLRLRFDIAETCCYNNLMAIVSFLPTTYWIYDVSFEAMQNVYDFTANVHHNPKRILPIFLNFQSNVICAELLDVYFLIR